MLRLYSSPKGFPFSALPAVYRDSLRASGAFQYPEKPAAQQEALAESDFLSYIRLDFFPRQGSLYALWELGGKPVSAARIEPYRDGVLLSGLETAPDFRGRGCASCLLEHLLEVIGRQGIPRVYSHVRKDNFPSLAVHKKCGFAVYKTTAVYLDGSADSRSYTLLLDFEKKLDFSRNM